MNLTERQRSESGITPTVRTIFSRYTPADIIDGITAAKVEAVLRWLGEEGLHPENSLILGSYLTGARLANCLAKTSSVTVLEIYPHLLFLLDPGVSFTTNLRDLDAGGWDFIVDTSGLGGINPGDLPGLGCPQAFLAEEPGSDGSDELLMNIDRTRTLLKIVSAPKSGVLRTDGLGTKTSGTMTLAVEILSHSMSVFAHSILTKAYKEKLIRFCPPPTNILLMEYGVRDHLLVGTGKLIRDWEPVTPYVLDRISHVMVAEILKLLEGKTR